MELLSNGAYYLLEAKTTSVAILWIDEKTGEARSRMVYERDGRNDDWRRKSHQYIPHQWGSPEPEQIEC